MPFNRYKATHQDPVATGGERRIGLKCSRQQFLHLAQQTLRLLGSDLLICGVSGRRSAGSDERHAKVTVKWRSWNENMITEAFAIPLYDPAEREQLPRRLLHRLGLDNRAA